VVRTHSLATSSSDFGWAQLRTLLASKAADAGKRVVVGEPASTSQYCSGRGTRVQRRLRLRVRTPVCSSCGLVLDREANVARTMLRAGQALVERWEWGVHPPW